MLHAQRGLPSPDRADAMAIAFAGKANAAPMAARRWGSQRPVKLARELAERVGEQPDIDHRQLIAALTRRAEGEQS